MTPEGSLLWEPTHEQKEKSRLTRYLRWLRERGHAFESYDALWSWSVGDPGAFWQSIWDHFGIRAHAKPTAALAERKMPGAKWFPGATLNYAEHALARRGEEVAILYRREDGLSRSMTRKELATLTARARAGLVRLGVGNGDRVAAFVPNTPETIAAFLATASLGAIWSSCAPEFGVGSVLDRFRQIEPKVLFACDGYLYNGKRHDRKEAVGEVAKGLPSLKATVVLDSPSWDSFLGDTSEPAFDPVPFDHPLWILYSSGTTGLPKPIVQGHGGILLEHFKSLALHCDLEEGDRFFWFTTTGWMMWNFLVSGLSVGATIQLWDGSPGHPDLGALWRFAAESNTTLFGTSAPFLLACQKAGIEPRELDLSRLRHIGSTGAPLPVEGFQWVYEHVKKDVQLGSMSGGTDICTAFVLGNPLLPVHAGEIQCRGLGCKVEAFDANGKPLVDEVGELVVTEPMPSMPIQFWNDPGGKRLRESYFETFPGVWRHGDWIKITKRGTCVIYGRSDSTLNRGGVRMGTSEFYSVVESLPEIADSLVVDTGALGADDKLWLFVVPKPGIPLDETLRKKLAATIRERLSPRHVPDTIQAVAEIPRTLNGKKLEVPVKRLLLGTPPEKALNLDTVANKAALDPFLALARRGN